MEAEDLAAASKTDESNVKRSFDKAIAAAGKAGFTHDEALDNELAGDYVASLGDDFWPRHYYTRAYELYGDWEAKAKMEHLLQKCGDCIDLKTTRRLSLSSSSRSALYFLSGELIEKHNTVNL
jgi:hypothetical protein